MQSKKNKLQGSIFLLLGTVIWGFSFIAQSVGMAQMGPFAFQSIRCLLAVSKKNKLQGSIFLLLGTVIWGFSFIAQSVGMAQMGPFAFQSIRCLLAVLFLLPITLVFDRGNWRASMQKWKNPQLWRVGLICGCALFAAATLQQLGLLYTDAGKAGFLTAMYIVLVPIIGLFRRKKPSRAALFSVALAVVGLYLLSCMGAAGINRGDLLLLGCALAFSVQINCIDALAGSLDGIRLNCIQCLVVAVLSAPFALVLETVRLENILACWLPLAYAGILSAPFALVLETVRLENILACWLPLAYAGILTMGVAYTLQILGQKRLEPTTASLIMSLESVFAALGGWLILHETMTPWETLGSCLVFTAVVVSQLPDRA